MFKSKDQDGAENAEDGHIVDAHSNVLRIIQGRNVDLK